MNSNVKSKKDAEISSKVENNIKRMQKSLNSNFSQIDSKIKIRRNKSKPNESDINKLQKIQNNSSEKCHERRIKSPKDPPKTLLKKKKKSERKPKVKIRRKALV